MFSQDNLPDATVDIGSLSVHDQPRLQNLPLAVWITIASFFDSAQTVARVSLACKRLNAVIQSHGWRTFVKSRFASLTLPRSLADRDWIELAKRLTTQSRAWDRRAFSLTSLVPPVTLGTETGRGRRRGRGRGRGRGRVGNARSQTFPAHIIVDASSNIAGHIEKETIVWGFGEDIVFQMRTSKHSVLQDESWASIPGVGSGFKSGEDDVTAISILDSSAQQNGLLVGRASGYLQLLSTNRDTLGQPIAWFQPLYREGGVRIEQRDIQHFDTNKAQDTMVVVTKENVMFYPLKPETWPAADPSIGTSDIVVEPEEALSGRTMPGSEEFRFLREAKYMDNGDIALCMTSSTEPLRYLTRTPAGTVLANASKMQASKRCTASYIFDDNSTQTARSVLPINTASTVGGSGNTVLSSYDDGTVRLQDLRTNSPMDAIFQDHFEVTTPVGPLLSYGVDRFIVGSARMPILKVFDFRWTRPYSYIDALPCNKSELGPKPKALTGMLAPVPTGIASCCYILGRQCSLHALAQSSFFRPNCNLYLPAVCPTVTPVYSLAKSSDMASSIYAGLTGELLRVSIKDTDVDMQESLYMQQMGIKNRCGYAYCKSLMSMVETGDGIALSDISQSKRLPLLFKQKGEQRSSHANGQLHRLDEAYM